MLQYEARDKGSPKIWGPSYANLQEAIDFYSTIFLIVISDEEISRWKSIGYRFPNKIIQNLWATP